MVIHEQTPEQRRWARQGLTLVAVTMFYNVVEAVVALWSGTVADSVALVGFGFDSMIEISAAGVLLWRLGMEMRQSDVEVIERTEHRVHRFVGGTFLLLATYVTAQSAWTLWKHEAPEESLPGILLAGASLLIMPIVAIGKLRIAKKINSPALRSEAKETIACSYLSLVLLLGLAANATFSWWWADPVAALLMVPWLVKEGMEGVRGRGCCDCE